MTTLTSTSRRYQIRGAPRRFVYELARSIGVPVEDCPVGSDHAEVRRADRQGHRAEGRVGRRRDPPPRLADEAEELARRAGGPGVVPRPCVERDERSHTAVGGIL